MAACSLHLRHAVHQVAKAVIVTSKLDLVTLGKRTCHNLSMITAMMNGTKTWLTFTSLQLVAAIHWSEGKNKHLLLVLTTNTAPLCRCQLTVTLQQHM